jgi:hypothetical protein
MSNKKQTNYNNYFLFKSYKIVGSKPDDTVKSINPDNYKLVNGKLHRWYNIFHTHLISYEELKKQY